MKKIKRFWKNNIIVCLFILVLLTFCIVFLSMILPMYTKSGNKYGKRLVGIENVKLDDKISSNIKSKLKENENIDKVTIKLKGKIYNIIINLKDNVDVNSVVDMAEESINELDEDELNYYDIQIFITSKLENEEGEQIGKTVVGYKNSNRENFSWTNNR